MIMSKYVCTHCGRHFEAEEKEILECPGCFWSTSVRREGEISDKDMEIINKTNNATLQRRPILLWVLLMVAICGFLIIKGKIPPHVSSIGAFKKASPPDDPDKEFLSQRSIKILTESRVTLMALQHGIDPDIAKQIIDDWEVAEFSGRTEGGEVIFPNASNTKEILTAISEKYKIPTSKVASLLVTNESFNNKDSDSSSLLSAFLKD